MAFGRAAQVGIGRKGILRLGDADGQVAVARLLVDHRPQADEIAEAVEDATVDEADASEGETSPSGGLQRSFCYERGLVDYVERLVRRYDEQREPGETFARWAHRVDEEALR